MPDYLVEVLVKSKVTQEELDMFLNISETNPDSALQLAQQSFTDTYSAMFTPITYRVYPIH